MEAGLASATVVDYVVIFVYLILTIGIGVFFGKFMKGGRDYFAGGNKIPWWISGISLYMTNFSAYTFVGLAGFVYLSGYYAVAGFLQHICRSGVRFSYGHQNFPYSVPCNPSTSI